MDDQFWRLWTLSEVAEQSPRANQFGILFSDYLMECWSYHIKPNDDDTASIYVDFFDGQQPLLLAETLTQFFEEYIADADQLLNKTRG